MWDEPNRAQQVRPEKPRITSLDYTFHHFPSIDSTNEEAKRLVAMGRGHNAVIWADQQTAGVGRRGRTWESPPGNLYCTVLEPMDDELAEAGRRGYLYGLAIARALNRLLASPLARVKWPNDVLIDRQKVAGVLLEVAECPETGQRFLIAGFGINVAHAPEAAPDALFKPTSIAAMGATTTADTLLVAVLAELRTLSSIYRLDGFSAIKTLWCASAHGMGQGVVVNLPDGSRVEGVFADLDNTGGLVLESDGNLNTIVAGDVFFRGNGIH